MSALRRFLREWKTLTPGEHLFALRRHRWLLVSLALLGAVGALAFSLTRQPLYQAEIQLVAAPNFPAGNAAEAGAGSNYVLQRARTYRKVVTSEPVLRAVIARLGLRSSPSTLAGRITVLSESDAAVLTIDVRDPSAQRAADIANAIGVEVPAYIERLETPAGTSVSPVKVTVARPAVTPDGVAYPRTPLNVVLGLVVGLLLGIALAVFRYAADPRIRGPRHAAAVAGSVALGSDPAAVIAAIRQRAGGLTSIAVAGPVDGPLRHTVTAEFAVALARAGETVVLVDADLHGPGTAFGVPGDVGLTTVLSDGIPATEAAARWRHPELSLFVLPAGPDPNALNLTEVRRSGRLAKVVQALQAADTVVVVAVDDLDPGLAVDAVESVVLIARPGATGVAELAAAASRLDGTPLLGVITLV